MAEPVADLFCLLFYCMRTGISEAAPGLPAWMYCLRSFITRKILIQGARQRNQLQGKNITEKHSRKQEYGLLLISSLPADWNAWNIAIHPGLCKGRQILHNREQKKIQRAQILATSCLFMSRQLNGRETHFCLV